MAFDGAGDVVAVGAALGPVDVGGGLLDPPPAQFQCFASRLAASDGAHVWSTGFGCDLNQYVPLGPHVAVDADGASLVVASIRGETDVGGEPILAYDTDVLVLQLSPSGATEWVETYDSGDYDQGLDAATDADGNLIATGHVTGTTDFGGGLVAAPTDAQQVFVVKAVPRGGAG